MRPKNRKITAKDRKLVAEVEEMFRVQRRRRYAVKTDPSEADVRLANNQVIGLARLKEDTAREMFRSWPKPADLTAAEYVAEVRRRLAANFGGRGMHLNKLFRLKSEATFTAGPPDVNLNLYFLLRGRADLRLFSDQVVRELANAWIADMPALLEIEASRRVGRFLRDLGG